MANKTVFTLELSKESVKELRDMVERYAKTLDQRCAKLLARLGEIGERTAREGFAGAQYDGTNDVSVTLDRVAPDTIRVVANGEAVAFIEFGSGLIGYGHPNAGALGFGPGTYPGKGHWDNPNGWTYYGEQGTNGVWVVNRPGRGDLFRTHGNPPAMGMANATEEMLREVVRIAQEEFDGW